MSVIAEVEQLALTLTDSERAKLADMLMDSLPEDFIDDTEIEEAFQRSREMDKDPTKVISHEDFFGFFRERRK